MASRQNAPHIDKEIGSRIRIARNMAGVSQEELAKALGVSFQQVQKYEKGVNRVAASRMHQLSNALHKPMSFFYGEDREAAALDATLTAFFMHPYAHELATMFLAVRQDQRVAVIQLLRSIAPVAHKESKAA